VLFDVSEGEDGSVDLLFEGRSLHFPPHAGPEVQAIASATGPFSAADLPGALDEPGRLVLVRRLVREGFVRLAR
jgi:hypothetical protein